MIEMLLCLSLVFAQEISARDFKTEQMRHSRVRDAYREKEASLKEALGKAELSYPPKEIFIRIFKNEKSLELWARNRDRDTFQMFKEYEICASSGELGPKRREMDGQVPEGFYWVDGFNPNSSFHLSLKINYPNDSDRMLGARGRLGGNICIHGNCVTIGCVPITDNGIKELYLMAVEARASGQQRIPVHIFPAKLKIGTQALLGYHENKRLTDFWANLKVGYDYFEQHKKLPRVSVGNDGSYGYNR